MTGTIVIKHFIQVFIFFNPQKITAWTQGGSVVPHDACSNQQGSNVLKLLMLPISLGVILNVGMLLRNLVVACLGSVSKHGNSNVYTLNSFENMFKGRGSSHVFGCSFSIASRHILKDCSRTAYSCIYLFFRIT